MRNLIFLVSIVFPVKITFKVNFNLKKFPIFKFALRKRAMRFPFLRTNLSQGEIFQSGNRVMANGAEMVRKEHRGSPWINLNRRKLAKIYAVEWTTFREEESV